MARVLLIEDDPLVVRMYQKVLAFEGFDIDSAPDGREGLIKAKEQVPDIIFCDVMMPKMNGIEVLEHLKSDPATAHIPVIMLTNLSGTHDAETALEKGAFAYMVKSEYKPKEVAEKAKQFISGIAQPGAQEPAVQGQTGTTVTPAVTQTVPSVQPSAPAASATPQSTILPPASAQTQTTPLTAQPASPAAPVTPSQTVVSSDAQGED